MQRGMLHLIRTQFKDIWSDRAFSWDLMDTALTDTEIRLACDYSISGYQSILGLRLLHQAINPNSLYVEMLADLTSTLNSHHLEISDVRLEAVLDHIDPGETGGEGRFSTPRPLAYQRNE